MSEMATNRQIKVLRLFRVPSPETLTKDEATFMITSIFSDPEQEARWDRYLFLTKDYGDQTDQLAPFSEAALASVTLPPDWDRHDEIKKANDSLAATLLADTPPFDDPPPAVKVNGKTFVFTGRFTYGKRDACADAVEALGGNVWDSMTSDVDYLVVGSEGSRDWVHGSYGSKIQTAVLARKTYGKPAIISEVHWREAIGAPITLDAARAAAASPGRATTLAGAVAPRRKTRKRVPSKVTFVEGYAVGFKMAVRDAFRRALDIQFRSRKVKGVRVEEWTQGEPPCYGFSQGDTVYDTLLAYSLPWSDALKHIELLVEVVDGYPDSVNGEVKSDGEIAVRFYRPNAARDGIEAVGFRTITQRSFVEFLQSGTPPAGI